LEKEISKTIKCKGKYIEEKRYSKWNIQAKKIELESVGTQDLFKRAKKKRDE
jgi:hypothetical protein